MKRRTLLTHTGSLVLLLGLPHLAWGASMLAVRMWPSKDYTRVTIESDLVLNTKHYTFTEPDRFVVDIHGMKLNDTMKEMSALVQASDPYVSGIRVGQFQPDVVRIVFDLKQRTTPNVFTLKPIAEYQNRLVFDFRPLADADPLNELVSEISTERTQALNEGKHNEADILGDWLEQQNQTDVNPSDAITTAHPHRLPTPSKVRANGATSVTPTSPTTPTNIKPPKPRTGRLKIIAIDPGHGGEDPGAIGLAKTKEKDVVLSIGKILRDMINQQPKMRAFMTRDADFFVPLAKRVQKARSVKADLFISIHADAFTNRSAKGASVFALSERGASSATARMLANKENESDLIGGVDVKARDQQTATILLSMSTAAQIRDSLKFGRLVVKELQTFANMHKKNVEQAGFAVLKAPDIPSILVETAFISNPEEEKKLRTAVYQKKIAQAILRAIHAYIAQTPTLARL